MNDIVRHPACLFPGGRPNLMFERPLDLENPIMK